VIRMEVRVEDSIQDGSPVSGGTPGLCEKCACWRQPALTQDDKDNSLEDLCQ
jgi:hypothetical protein